MITITTPKQEVRNKDSHHQGGRRLESVAWPTAHTPRRGSERRLPTIDCDGTPATGTPRTPPHPKAKRSTAVRRPTPSYGIEINRHTVEFSRNRRPNHPHQTNTRPADNDPALSNPTVVFPSCFVSEPIRPFDVPAIPCLFAERFTYSVSRFRISDLSRSSALLAIHRFGFVHPGFPWRTLDPASSATLA